MNSLLYKIVLMISSIWFAVMRLSSKFKLHFWFCKSFYWFTHMIRIKYIYLYWQYFFIKITFILFFIYKKLARVKGLRFCFNTLFVLRVLFRWTRIGFLFRDWLYFRFFYFFFLDNIWMVLFLWFWGFL